MKQLNIFDCSNVIIASFFTDERVCAHENREHTLIYLCSGRLEIEERGTKTTLHPQKWLIKRRLEAAYGLIKSGKKKVTEACFDVGFKNLSHFSKVYKDTYGYVPSMT